MGNETFIDRFIELMKLNGKKTYKQVSVETSVPESTISHWVNEGKSPSMYNLIQLANYFDTTIDYLVGRDPVFDSNDIAHHNFSQDELNIIYNYKRCDKIQQASIKGYIDATLQNKR